MHEATLIHHILDKTFMKITKSILVTGLAIFLFACQHSNSEIGLDKLMQSEAAVADSTTAGLTTSDAAVVNSTDTVHKFIRTADLRFKVKDVASATYKIEDAVRQQGGFITYTNMAGNIANTTVNAISEDSSIVSTHYTVTNSITLRVPDSKLDTTLKAIAANVDFLDIRVIKAEDVSLQILANKIANSLGINHAKRIANAIDDKGKKLNDIVNAEEKLLVNQKSTADSKIANLALADQIKYSTVTLSLYQLPVMRNEIVANDKNIQPYKQPFGTRILASLHSGWELVESLVIFIANLWALILLLIIGYMLFKKHSHNLVKTLNKSGV